MGRMPGMGTEEQEGRMMEMRDSQEDDRGEREGRRTAGKKGWKQETGMELKDRSDERDRRGVGRYKVMEMGDRKAT